MGACGICGLASPNKRLFADSIKHRSCEDILFGCFCRVCDIKWSFNLQNKTDTHRPDSCLLKPVDLHVCFLLGTPHCYLTQAFTWCNLTDEGFIYHHLQIRAKKKEKTARNGCLVWTGADIHLSSRLQKTVCKFSGLNFNKKKKSVSLNLVNYWSNHLITVKLGIVNKSYGERSFPKTGSAACESSDIQIPRSIHPWMHQFPARVSFRSLDLQS